MRAGDIQNHLNERSELLCTGQFEELAKLYHLPFVEYHDGFPNFVENRSNAVETIAKIGSLLTAQNVIRLEPEVLSVELAKNNRFKVLSQYSVINRCGGVLGRSNVKYFFTETPEGPRVAMLEYNKCP